MDDFVAYPSRWKIALLVLASVGFVALGVWMAGVFGEPPTSRRLSPEMTRVIGWLSIVLFGFSSVGWTRRLFDEREQVRIGPAGIRLRSWSEQTIPWSEIVDITTWSYRRQTSIILHLRDRNLFPGRGVVGLLAGASRGITGGDIAISLTGTDRKTKDAFAAIERYRPAGTAT